MSNVQHRSGPLKQKNKAHKGPKKRIRHDSVGSIKSAISKSSSFGSRKGQSICRTVRRNQLIQLRRLKREELINAKRGISVAPILISILDLSNNVNHFLKLLETFDPKATFQTSKHGNYIHLDMPRFRTQYQISVLDRSDLPSSLDVAKVSDILLIIHSTEVERFEINDPELIKDDFLLLDAIYNFCLPKTVHGILGLEELKNVKQKDHVRKTIFKVISKNYPGLLMDGSQAKLRSLDTPQDLLKLFLYCSNVKRSSSKSFCSRRSQVLAENFEFIPSETDASIGTLQVDGFIRNNPLNVNSLIYIPDFGEFQMDELHTIPNPYGDEKKSRPNINFSMKADPNIRPSLERENPIQTLFEEEMRTREEEMLQDAKVEQKKVPKGTSDYQATWLIESDNEGDDQEKEEEEEEKDDDLDEGDELVERIRKIKFAPVDVEDDDNIDDNESDLNDQDEQADPVANYDQEMDLEDERQALVKFKEERQYEMFPDEIDTPQDRSARERFLKYRGLKSFRTSQWDPKENLPPDYSRICQFENFNRVRRRIFKSEPIGADPGYYVRCYLSNVPKMLADYFGANPSKPLVLNELLAHEHKMSVMNIVIRKVSSYTMPIKSKEELVFHVGYRRFCARPIFSAHTTGDKHKYEKFLRSDSACVATLYAPLTYPIAPVLVYKHFKDDNTCQLVATGSLLDCSPDRLVIKRYVLSGHPFKINKRHAVVRYMFFNRDDILWFRPVELRTKYGRHGHILEPLGTHGHMKCRFDHQLTSQDTVLMYLYKRVFPKWYYEPLNVEDRPTITLTTNSDDNSQMDQDG